MSQVGKIFVYVGIFLIVFGLLFQGMEKWLGLGRLPGDIYVKKGPVTFYFPLATSLLISLILSLLLSLFWRR